MDLNVYYTNIIMFLLLYFTDLQSQVVKVHATALVDCNGHQLQASHLRWRRVGTVGWHWNQADVAVPLTPWVVVRLDGSQPGIFSLRTTELFLI